ncbi:MAG: RNA polymerase sigma factor [Candidatus Cryptobacteroides sp.]|nr:RNA polymerase sigma factor [Bacteroidales bacterium]
MRLFRNDTERQIAEDIRKGSHTAMKELYDSWSGYLFALCRRYVPDREAAEDLLQDSFVKIFSSIDSFTYKGPGSLKAWMSRITVNEALQYLRKRKHTDFIEYKDYLPDQADDEEPDVGTLPPSEIQRMIGELPDGYRTIFNLFVFEEKSHKEIAALLGITESTSASQFHRARKILAKKIKDYETGLDRNT